MKKFIFPKYNIGAENEVIDASEYPNVTVRNCSIVVMARDRFAAIAIIKQIYTVYHYTMRMKKVGKKREMKTQGRRRCRQQLKNISFDVDAEEVYKNLQKQKSSDYVGTSPIFLNGNKPRITFD
jgi:hypothetical protein